MTVKFEDLKVLQVAETAADGIWKIVVTWDRFAKETVGKQLTRAVDSVGANIAEGYGRYHFGEKLKFFYYARGSLFETKYWLNRVHARQLMPDNQVQQYVDALSGLALQLNVLSKNTKQQQTNQKKSKTVVREPNPAYQITQEFNLEEFVDNKQIDLFTPDELAFLSQLSGSPEPQLPNYSITQLPLGDQQ